MQVLFVDDDRDLLAAVSRRLHRKYDFDIAASSAEALVKIKEDSYAVVVSDLRMPEMNGIELLYEIRKISPDAVRIMLTGEADLSSAVDAVNYGHVFRFLTKPCSAEALSHVIDAGIEQYRLVIAERELLEKTLKGSVNVLIDVLALSSPEAFARATRVCRLVRGVVRELNLDCVWEYELAGMLSQLGCVTVPADILRRQLRGEELSRQERGIFEQHPKVAGELLAQIPRLGKVARMVALQAKHLNGEGFPAGPPYGEDIPWGAKILHVVLEYDRLLLRGYDSSECLQMLSARHQHYERRIVEALRHCLHVGHAEKYVRINALKPDMIMCDDVKTNDGVVLVTAGQELSRSLIVRLSNFDRLNRLRDPVRVLVQE